MFKKWIWSDEGRVVDSTRWLTKQTIHVAVVEDTAEKADEFAPGSGIIRECFCSTDTDKLCAECLLMYASSPRYL